MKRTPVFIGVLVAMAVLLVAASSSDLVDKILQDVHNSTTHTIGVSISQESITGAMTLGSSITVNDLGNDADSRIEGDTDANLFYVDAGNDRVGIGTSTPTSLFHVDGASDLDGAVIINESSADVDTRIESNGSANAIFVDAGNDRIGLFNGTPAVAVDVTGAVNLDGGHVIVNEDSGAYNFRVEGDGNANLISTDGTNDRVGLGVASPGVFLDIAGVIETNSGTFTHNQDSGDYDFTVESDGNAAALFVDAGNDRVGIFTAAPAVAFEVTGATTINGAVIVNDSSADVDTRIESNGNENAIFVDAGNDRVGIFTAAPSVPLEVTGNTLITGSLTTTGAADIPADITLENDEVLDNSVNGTVQVQSETALTNTVSPELSLLHTTSGVPAAGIGTGISFVQETSAANNEIIMSLDAVVTDETGASEDAKFSVSLMAAGNPKDEKFSVSSTGVVTLVNAATIDNSTNGTVTITEPVLSLQGTVVNKSCTLGDTDLTPDVSAGCYWLLSQANSAPTAISDLDNPTVGATYCILVGNAGNPPTLADAGNFNLSAAWTPGIDDIICLYVQADNDYIEISRVDN